MTSTPETTTESTETRPKHATGAALAAVCPENGDPRGYTFECNDCGTFFEAYTDWLDHSLSQGYETALAAEQHMTVRYRTGEATSIFGAMHATVEDAATTPDGRTAYVTTNNPECHHLYHDCPYFPAKYEKTTTDATRKRRCSHCSTRARKERGGR